MFITQSYYALLVFFSLGKKKSMCYTVLSSIPLYSGENITSTKVVQSLLNSFLTACLKTMVCGCFVFPCAGLWLGQPAPWNGVPAKICCGDILIGITGLSEERKISINVSSHCCCVH